MGKKKGKAGFDVLRPIQNLCHFADDIFMNIDHFVHAPSQWETMLHCNIVSQWLGVYTKWSVQEMFGIEFWIKFHWDICSWRTNSMAKCKTALTPLLMHWSYCSLCTKPSHWWQDIIASDSGSVPNRRQATAWTDDDQAPQFHITSLGLNELKVLAA